MWCKLETQVASNDVDRLMDRALSVRTSSETGQLVASGKYFFGRSIDDRCNLDLLRKFHTSLWPELAKYLRFDNPVLDHCYLLVKSPGAKVTPLHQDRPYWTNKETVPSIISVWVALEPISHANGGLMLSLDNLADVSELDSFNKSEVLEHVSLSDPSVSFPLIISDTLTACLSESLHSVEMGKGQAIVFDSFEPHMSCANVSNAPRVALKIAYGEYGGSPHIFARVDQL